MFAVRNKFASFGLSCFSSLQKALNQPSLGLSFVVNRNAFPNLALARSYSETAVPPKVLISTTNDPFFNISVEDYLLQTADLTKPILYIWRNEPTVFIGRNQNPWKECFLQEMDKDNVHLVRRYSGGGAVYQVRSNFHRINKSTSNKHCNL
jgi:lipoate-protein ligase A